MRRNVMFEEKQEKKNKKSFNYKIIIMCSVFSTTSYYKDNVIIS